jgi:dTDP-4-dehydrorhamnose 3,5-epimerase
MTYKKVDVSTSKILPEVLLIKPSVNWDIRGNIYSSFNKDFYVEILPEILDFKHDKFAQSIKNVLRGLHGDNKTWKLVSCVWGEIFEVVVDMRPDSNTFKKWDAFDLSSDNYSQVLIPPGYVNGYYVKSEHAIFHYKLAYGGEHIDAEEQKTIFWNDPEIGIKWPCSDPILQARDNM